MFFRILKCSSHYLRRFFEEPKMVLLWHRCENPLWNLHFKSVALSQHLHAWNSSMKTKRPAILSGSDISDVMMCNSSNSLFLLHYLRLLSPPKHRTKGRCRAAHLCLFNPRQGDVLCVELRVTQRFPSIIHRAAAASVLLFNSLQIT